jgi:hypothetical protein
MVGGRLGWWCVCFDIPGARPSRASRLSGGSLIFASGEPQFSLLEKRRAEERKASIEQKVADAITRFTGSMPFVYLHAVFFGLWILINLGWLGWFGLRPDPSLVILAMIASVEAIFLSTFILISQNPYGQFEQIITWILTISIAVIITIALLRLILTIFQLLVIGALNPLNHQEFELIFGMIMTLLIAMEFNHSILQTMERLHRIIQVKTHTHQHSGARAKIHRPQY